MNINVLDKTLQRVGIVMQYSSLIWDKRYTELGDCELYLPATMDAINLLQKGFYLTRDDDDMVCIIRRIEITTDEEQGNMLIVTGKDVRCLLDQRVQQVPGKFTNAVAEAAIRQMVTWAVINAGADGSVNVMYKGNTTDKLVGVQQNSDLTDRITTPFGYGVAGEKIREVQRSLGWGGRMFLQSGQLIYETYKGEDKTALVKFNPQYHTLKTSDYVEDVSPFRNVTYIVSRYQMQVEDFQTDFENVQYYGTATGINRYEQFVDARGTTSKMNKSSIESAYPGGTWTNNNGIYFYGIGSWTFAVPSQSMKDWLDANVSPVRISYQEIGGVTYATWLDATIAWAKTNTLASDTSCQLNPAPFFLYMIGKAKEENAMHPETITFTAEVVPDLVFKYKEDYDLGDLVTIENEYEISKTARITEVFESWDETGYTLNIKFDE